MGWFCNIDKVTYRNFSEETTKISVGVKDLVDKQGAD